MVIWLKAPAARHYSGAKETMRSIIGLAILVIGLGPTALAQKWSECSIGPYRPSSERFCDGCCVTPSIPRPKNLSHATVPETTLLQALHCATNNSLVERTRDLAEYYGDRTALHIAYHYGDYMLEAPVLTVAVYSVDGKSGVLFDIGSDSSKYFINNFPSLLRTHQRWRVGEIYGGLWSYTRLWHLAQEIGSRPPTVIPVADIEKARPAACWTPFDTALTDYYPLQLGNWWIYTVKESSGKNTRLKRQVDSYDSGYTLALSLNGHQDSFVKLLKSESGDIWETETPTLQLKSILQTGDHWFSGSRGNPHGFEVVSQGNPCTAGRRRFDDCVIVREVDQTSDHVVLTTYARGVGPVSYVYFKGPKELDRTMTIQSWHVRDK